MRTESEFLDPSAPSANSSADYKAFAVLLFLVVLSRIPFLLTGFGAEGDAWRIANTALQFWNEGTYTVSRFIGFPVYELLNAPLIGMGGSFASNVATLAFFLVALFVLKRILEIWQVPSPTLLLVSFAFFPLLWKNSAATMDYIWGLTGILAALLFFLRRKFILAGILLGLAAGTRISHIAYVIPFLLLVKPEERSNWRTFALWAIAATAISYIPAFTSSSFSLGVAQYNPGTLHQPLWQIAAFGSYRLVYSVGLLGFIGATAIVLSQRKRIGELLSHRTSIFCIACTGLTIVLFAVFPDKREYLIPAIPFSLIALFSLAKHRQIIVAITLLLSYAFVNIDTVEHNTTSPTLKPTILPGIVIDEFTRRLEFDRQRKYIASLELPDFSIIMVGSGPAFGLENPHVEPNKELSEYLHQHAYKSKRGNIYYVYSLNREQLQEMRRRGFQIYYVENAGNYLESFIGYRLADEGIVGLEVGEK